MCQTSACNLARLEPVLSMSCVTPNIYVLVERELIVSIMVVDIFIHIDGEDAVFN